MPILVTDRRCPTLLPTIFSQRLLYYGVVQGAVGLAIWVAAVGNQKKPSKESSTQLGLVGGGSGELPTGWRVWRQASGQDAEIELITLSTDDDPNSIYISDEVLMNECQVRFSFDAFLMLDISHCGSASAIVFDMWV